MNEASLFLPINAHKHAILKLINNGIFFTVNFGGSF